MANPFQGEDFDYFEAARDEEGNIKREAPKAAPKKGRIVTKEELAKSGYTNLRDFLNAEKGLTRRGEKGPDAATIARIDQKAKEEKKGPTEDDINRLIKKYDTKDRPGSEIIAEKQLKAKPKMGAAYQEAFGNIKKALGFKSGGSVSSASKRADGCAVKGKTRGRMV